jgi:hypothetical protein
MRNPNFPFHCLLSSWLFGLIGLTLGFICKPEWFGRFGSLIVLFAVMSEYALLQFELSKLYQSLKGEGGSECGNSGIPDLKPSTWHQQQALMSHITIVIGTIIWGFGDQFF